MLATHVKHSPIETKVFSKREVIIMTIDKNMQTAMQAVVENWKVFYKSGNAADRAAYKASVKSLHNIMVAKGMNAKQRTAFIKSAKWY